MQDSRRKVSVHAGCGEFAGPTKYTEETNMSCYAFGKSIELAFDAAVDRVISELGK